MTISAVLDRPTALFDCGTDEVEEEEAEPADGSDGLRLQREKGTIGNVHGCTD